VEPSQLVLEGVLPAAASGEADRIDHGVIGQRGGRDSVQGKALTEGRRDDWSGDAAVRGHRKCVAGAVVEPADDLHVGAWGAVGSGEPVVGEVGLPRLVRHRCFEPDVGGLRTFPGLGGHEPGAAQVAADRGPGDHRGVVLFEVPGDRVGTSVQTGDGEFVAQLEDQLDEAAIKGAGGGPGSSGSGLEGGLALGVVAGDELGDPALGEAVGGGDFGLGAALDDDGGDDQPGFGHDRASNSRPGFLCLET